MPVTRRQVLAAMAATSVAGALGVGTLAYSWWDRPPGVGLQALSDDEHAFVQALAEAWMPPGGTPALSGADARLGNFLDDVVAAMPHSQGVELKLLLNVLDDFTGPRRLSRFQYLEREQRTAILQDWLQSPNHYLRNGVLGIVALLAFGWFYHPDVIPMARPWYRCGYGP